MFFEKIGEIAHDVFDGCTAKILDASIASFENITCGEGLHRDKLSNFSKSQDTILMKDWLGKHVYDTEHPTDKEYVVFANRICNILEREFLTIPDFLYKPLAIALTCYVEDKQSGLGLFASYVAMVRRENGARHPFVSSFGDIVPMKNFEKYIDEYSDEKMNIIDIVYLLAQNISEYTDKADNHVKKAKRLLELMVSEGYNNLPSNREYFDDLCNLVKHNGWQGLKTFLLWVIDKSYFLSSVTSPIAVQMQGEDVKKIYNLKGNEYAHACKLDLATEKRVYGLGVRPATLIEEFAIRARLDAEVVQPLKEIEVVSHSFYEIQSVSKGSITIHGMLGTYTVCIEPDDHTQYVVGHCIHCKLVKYGEMWHFLICSRLRPPVSAKSRNTMFGELDEVCIKLMRHR